MRDKGYYDELMLFDDRKKSYTISFRTMKKACKLLTDEELGAVMKCQFEYSYSRISNEEELDSYDRADFLKFVLGELIEDEDAYYQSFKHRCETNKENRQKGIEKQREQNTSTIVDHRQPSSTNLTDKDIDTDKVIDIALDSDSVSAREFEKDNHTNKARITSDVVYEYASELKSQGYIDAPRFVNRFLEKHPRLSKNWKEEFNEFLRI